MTSPVPICAHLVSLSRTYSWKRAFSNMALIKGKKLAGELLALGRIVLGSLSSLDALRKFQSLSSGNSPFPVLYSGPSDFGKNKTRC